MRDPLNWNLRVASWRGVSVRVHVSLLVFVAATLCLSWQAANAGWHLFALSVGGLAVLVASILVHESGHLRVARRLAMLPSSISLGPFGGLAGYPATGNARSDLRLSAAGLLANLAVCFVCLPLALLADRDFMRLGADGSMFGINPMESAWILRGPTFAVAVKLVLWINGLLVLINLLPAFPFDGGRLLRSTLRVLFPSLECSRVATITFWAAVFLASLLAVAAMVLWNSNQPLVFPTWIAPAFLAAVTMIGATHEFVTGRDPLAVGAPAKAAPPTAPAPRRRADLDAPVASAATEDPPFLFEPPDDEFADTWAESPYENGKPRNDTEAEEERLLDEILTKLHAYGLDSISEQEREFLQRVSARYRQRS